jgi:hypothetical protein
MRRILIDRAREKRSAKRDGGRQKLDIDAVDVAIRATTDQLLRAVCCFTPGKVNRRKSKIIGQPTLSNLKQQTALTNSWPSMKRWLS